jgi:hypothetical protein
MSIDQPTAADLETLHKSVVSSPDGAPERALIVLAQFAALLDAADLPGTHTYWNHFYYYKLKRLFEQRRLGEGLQLAEVGVAAAGRSECHVANGAASVPAEAISRCRQARAGVAGVRPTRQFVSLPDGTNRAANA